MSQRFEAGPQSMLRAINERAVLELIDREGPLTRTEVARQTGLSKPTASVALTSLLERHAVQEVGYETGRKGPAPVLYRVDPGCAWGIGVDVGRGVIRVAIADATGAVRAQSDDVVPAEVHELAARVARLCSEMALAAGIELNQVTQIVVGVPAVVGPDGDQLRLGEGLPEAGQGLIGALRRLLPVPLVVENDVNLAALAEGAQGHGLGVENFVMVSIGVGLGLGVIIGGALYRGVSGAAGEIGYLPGRLVGADDQAGEGGQAGSGDLALVARADPIEAYTGAAYFVRRAEARGLPAGLSAQQVFDRALAGDQAAVAAVDDGARGIAFAISCITPLLDPEVIVLGGALGAHGGLLLEPVSRHLSGLSPFRPRMVSSALGSQAVLLGATAMAVQQARAIAFGALTGTARV